jgi:hypothetical protein
VAMGLLLPESGSQRGDSGAPDHKGMEGAWNGLEIVGMRTNWDWTRL